MDNVVIEGFELLEKLGEGGMGSVYKARQVSLDRMVAIKILPRHVVQEAGSVERFLIEAKIAAALKHNNIIQVYEAGKSGEDYFFVMEWVTGYTIAGWLERRGHLPETDALLVVESIADALAYAWEKAWIVHGDIKPANIMVDGDGTIKLADFLALTPPGGAERPESLKRHVVGTPNYMSPEQACGTGTLDFRTDIYSLGAVLYQLVTGHMPFEQEADPREIMRRQITDFIPDPQDVNPELSDACAWLIEKMMVKQTKRRYHDWQETLSDIRRVKHGEMPGAPLPAAGSSTIERCAKRESAMLKLPDQQTTHRIEENMQHRDDRSARIRITAYLLSFMLALAGGCFIWLRYENLLPAWLIGEESIPAIAPVPTVESQQPLNAPPPSLPAPLQIIPAVPPQPAVIELKNLTVEEDVEAPPVTAVADLYDPEHTKALLDYMRVFQRMVPLLRNRQITAGLTLLNTCLSNAAPGAFREQAEQDALRLEQIRDMEKRIIQNRHALKGQPVRAEPNISGTLADITEDSIAIKRPISGGKEAIISVPISRVQESSLRRLVLAADPSGADRCEVVWSLATLRFDEADAALRTLDDGADREALTAWRQDWGRLLMNIRALDVFERINTEIGLHHWTEARRLASAAESKYADTDLLSRIKNSEWIAIQTQLNNEAPALQEPLTEDPVEVLPIEKESPDLPSSSASTGSDEPETEDASRLYDIQEIKESYVELDGQTIRLRFRFRDDIRQTDEETYTTELGSEYGRITAVFPQEALHWIKRLPKGGQGRPRRSVYGTVDASLSRVMLTGRKKNRSGSPGGEYVW